MSRVRNLGTQQLHHATRAGRPGWRDPRLWIGVAVVIASVAAGARVVGSAEDTVAVWALAEDVGAGDTLTHEDLVARQVDLGDARTLDRYLPAVEDLPGDRRTLLRTLGAGELLPRAALGGAGEGQVHRVPVWAPSEAVPPGLGPGAVVDVWAAGGSDRPAERLLDDVVVLEVPEATGTLGPQGSRQVVLGVPAEADGALAPTISAAVDGGVVITGQG